ncbi:PASTA domain-containing protein [Streptomyces sp. DSM 41699]|uniref:PASTA domain-containing protein n=1 Tax=Streptomyces gibsoniae TaxID=3075529 RepID=A0ABU2U2C4_9ACTN|nr:PASTA domain-containing protein [Streptomyces sp. DSM 41699]MDT0467375.1 PASTA domain-containing protein [Streptomyces sp. DSM 41699]
MLRPRRSVPAPGYKDDADTAPRLKKVQVTIGAACRSRGSSVVTLGLRRRWRVMKKIITSAVLAAFVFVLGGTAHADDPMPNVTGENLAIAYGILHYDHSIKVKDVSGAGRHVLWLRNWKVCRQSPAAGSSKANTAITLGAVKTKESCPAI